MPGVISIPSRRKMAGRSKPALKSKTAPRSLSQIVLSLLAASAALFILMLD